MYEASARRGNSSAPGMSMFTFETSLYHWSKFALVVSSCPIGQMVVFGAVTQRPSMIGLPVADRVVFTSSGVMSSPQKISKSGCRSELPAGRLMKSRYVTFRLSCGGGSEDESLQTHPASRVQVAAHPSPSVVLPSSQGSGASFMPSPHFDSHRPVEQSGSNMQEAEHPSPSTALPSSHASVPSFFPSPQTVARHIAGWAAFGGVGGGEQTNPGSTRHAAEQPCPPLGGSHCSAAGNRPSPHRGVQSCPGCTQSQPASPRQVAAPASP